MLFKSAIIYTFSTIPPITDEALQPLAFAPCAKQEEKRGGFVNPAGFDSLVGWSPERDLILICLQFEEKILPPAVVSKATDEKVAEREKAEDRRLGKREREEIRELVTLELLPRAFSKYRRTYAIVDLRSQLLMVDGSSGRADELTGYLREALGSLPVSPINTNAQPAVTMTDWLNQGMPAGFSVGYYCKLQEVIEGGGSSAYRNEDPTSALVRAAIEAGQRVTELAISAPAKLDFVLTDGLAMKSIYFADLLVEEVVEQADGDDRQRALADLVLVGRTISGVVNDLASAFGGKVQPELDLDHQERDAPTSDDYGQALLAAANNGEDPLLDLARDFVQESGRASISSLQRKLRVGYNRAARLIESLEDLGVVSPMSPNGTREVIQQKAEEYSA